MAIVAPFGVDHEQDEQRIASHADHVAPLLALGRAIPFVQAKRIIEDEGGQGKLNPVLGEVGAFLALIPFKDHSYIQCSSIYTGESGTSTSTIHTLYSWARAEWQLRAEDDRSEERTKVQKRLAVFLLAADVSVAGEDRWFRVGSYTQDKIDHEVFVDASTAKRTGDRVVF